MLNPVTICTLNNSGVPEAVSPSNPIASSSVSGNVITLPYSLNVLATKITQTFSAPVRAVIVTVAPNTAATVADAMLKITFDAINDALATSWLDHTIVGNHVPIKPADGAQEITFNGETITRVDYSVFTSGAVGLNVALQGVV